MQVLYRLFWQYLNEHFGMEFIAVRNPNFSESIVRMSKGLDGIYSGKYKPDLYGLKTLYISSKEVSIKTKFSIDRPVSYVPLTPKLKELLEKE